MTGSLSLEPPTRRMIVFFNVRDFSSCFFACDHDIWQNFQGKQLILVFVDR